MTPNGADLRTTALYARAAVIGCNRGHVPDGGDASPFGCRLHPWGDSHTGRITGEAQEPLLGVKTLTYYTDWMKGIMTVCGVQGREDRPHDE
jgi:hypothetical protein